MPFDGFEDFDECKRTMMEEDGHDESAAENICGALQQEAKSEHGNVDELMNALNQGAGLIADVGVDLVSGVDVPAVDSKWVMTKSEDETDGHDFRANSPVLLSKEDGDSDARIAYAAAMIPREPDKEGDVVSTPTVERAAHDFLKQSGGVDTDHSLIDGEGDVVESWVLKEERTFDLPGGETESYGPGTWMTGIEWGKDAWERIKAGELTGLSIYGMAEHVPLSRSASGQVCSSCGDELTTTKDSSTDDDSHGDTHKGDGSDSRDMGKDTDGGGDGADGGTDDGPTIGELQASVSDLSDSVSDVTDTVESVKDAVETEKQDAQEAAALIAEEYDEFAPGDILDMVQAAAGKEVGDVLDALDSVGKEDDGMDDEDDDEEEAEKETAEKRADDANVEKGGDSRTTAAKAHDSSGDSTGLSYKAIAEEEAE